VGQGGFGTGEECCLAGPRTALAGLNSGLSNIVLIVGLLIIILSILFAERAQSARRNAREFRESEARFRHLADAASDWFWETDAEFICTWVSFDVHPLWGVDRANVVGHPAWAWPGIQLEDPNGMRARLDALTRVRQPFRNVVIHAQYPGFDARDISISGVPVFDKNGNFAGYQGTSTDITRQIEVENQLRQSQKLEAVGQLTGGVAHDFNNLLAVTMSNGQMLEMALQERNDLSSMAHSIVAASERGAELTHRLLAFSRKQTLRPQILQLDVLCEEMHNLLLRSLGETLEIKITIHDEPWNVLADPGEIESALLNLSINASHAMPDGGKLGIAVKNISVTDREWVEGWEGRTGDYVVLQVSDSGTGMPEDVIKHAFEPFFTTKEIGQGSGLGLSMVHGFAQQSGGFATIESQLSIGTTVSIYLPRVEAQQAAQEVGEIETNLAKGDGELILLVEDEEAVRETTVNILEMLGYAVVAAQNSEEALALASSLDRIDLMVSDVVLPGQLNGIQTYELIRKARPDLKCLFMSGYMSKFNDALPDGAWLLTKPVPLRMLANSVKTFLTN
jgi:PAS domain S-box-containing protein